MTQHHAGRHFLQIPGPTNVPDRVLRAIDNPTIDHRGPAFGRLGLEILDQPAGDLPDQRPGGDLSGLRHRRVGGGADQHAVARRRGADVPHRLVRHAVERDGAAARPQADLHRHRLAARRRCGRDRRGAGRRQGAPHQGGLRGAQRDLDRLHQPHRRGAARDGCGAAIRRC